jgi:uncharacterized protein
MSADRVIDADGHIIEKSDSIAEFMSEEEKNVRPIYPHLERGHSQAVKAKPGTFRRVSAEQWVEAMDEMGVDITVAYPTAALSYGLTNEVTRSIEETTAYNNYLNRDFLLKSSRIKGMGIVPIRDTESAIKELNRCVNELGMPGIVLPPLGLPALLGNKMFHPFYKEANKLECAIAFHGGPHIGLGMDQESSLNTFHTLGHPFAQSLTFMSMFNENVFNKFPGIRFGFLEAGPDWIQVCWMRPDDTYEGFPETNRNRIGHFNESYEPSDEISRLIRDGQIFIGCGSEKTLPSVIGNVGNAFMFSSDYPHEVTVEDVRKKIKNIRENEKLSPEDKEAILYRNAARFYGIKD